MLHEYDISDQETLLEWLISHSPVRYSSLDLVASELGWSPERVQWCIQEMNQSGITAKVRELGCTKRSVIFDVAHFVGNHSPVRFPLA